VRPPAFFVLRVQMYRHFTVLEYSKPFSPVHVPTNIVFYHTRVPIIVMNRF
jgi:hypothetical protein